MLEFWACHILLLIFPEIALAGCDTSAICPGFDDNKICQAGELDCWTVLFNEIQDCNLVAPNQRCGCIESHVATFAECASAIYPAGRPCFECIYSELCHGSTPDSCAATPIQPDLVVDVLAASPSGSVDRTDGCVVPVAATLAVFNIGDQAVPNGTTAELSIFRVGESASVFSENCSTGFIGANQSSACMISGDLTCELAEGDYFMSARVDPGQLIAESNEDNNTRFLPIFALPEPSTWALVLTSGATLCWLCRGRKLLR